MNILLVNPPSMPYKEIEELLDKTSILRIPTLAMPVGLMELAAFTRENCEILNIKILEIGKELADFSHKRERLEAVTYHEFLRSKLDSVDFVPDITGISSMFSCSRKSTIEIAFIVKEKWKHCVTIVGGNYATAMYKDFLNNECVNYVARGEAEYSFIEFVDHLAKGDTNFNIQGIFNKEKSLNAQSEFCPLVQDLGKLPLPAFDLIDLDWYLNSPIDYGASLVFSRGCPFKCTFCGTHTVHSRKVRHKSNEQCLREVKFLLDKGFKHIKPEDDIWAIDKKKFLHLSDEIAKIRGDCKFELFNGISVSLMDEDKIDAMMRIGITGAPVAIESGSPYVQKHIIKKFVDLEKAKRLIDYMRKVGFKATGYFIFGFPGETDKMRKESIEYIKTLDVNWAYIFNCQPIPGSELFSEFEKVTDMKKVDWDSMRVGRRTFDTTEISAEDLENITYDANIEVNFFENSNMRHGRYELAISYWNDMIIKPYPFHIIGRYCRAIAYFKLNRTNDAITDLEQCVYWIKKNKESKRLFDRYSNKMPLLKKFLGDSSYH